MFPARASIFFLPLDCLNEFIAVRIIVSLRFDVINVVISPTRSGTRHVSLALQPLLHEQIAGTDTNIQIQPTEFYISITPK